MIKKYKEFRSYKEIHRIKKISESSNETLDWNGIIEYLDVYQLYELLLFTYGDTFPDTKISIDEEEGDYNPDHIYEIILYELQSTDRYEDFVENFNKYKLKQEESDPTHWRHRNKLYDDLAKGWSDFDNDSE